MVSKKTSIGLAGTAAFVFIFFQFFAVINTAFDIPALLYFVKWLAVAVGVIIALKYASDHPTKGMALVIVMAIIFMYGLPRLINDTVHFIHTL